MSYTKRDSKDPMPNAQNTPRKDGGNVPYPAGAEEHNQSKATKVSASQNRSTGPAAMAVAQPTRQKGDGNTVVTGEMHNSAKAERVPESARW